MAPVSSPAVLPRQRQHAQLPPGGLRFGSRGFPLAGEQPHRLEPGHAAGAQMGPVIRLARHIDRHAEAARQIGPRPGGSTSRSRLAISAAASSASATGSIPSTALMRSFHGPSRPCGKCPGTSAASSTNSISGRSSAVSRSPSASACPSAVGGNPPHHSPSSACRRDRSAALATSRAGPDRVSGNRRPQGKVGRGRSRWRPQEPGQGCPRRHRRRSVPRLQPVIAMSGTLRIGGRRGGVELDLGEGPCEQCRQRRLAFHDASLGGGGEFGQAGGRT